MAVRILLLMMIVLAGGCSKSSSSSPTPTQQIAEAPSRILGLFKRIRIGMPRQDVEAFLGPPVFDPLPVEDAVQGGVKVVFYLDRPDDEVKLEFSTRGLGGLKVKYRDGDVVGKAYNPRWVAPGQRGKVAPEWWHGPSPVK